MKRENSKEPPSRLVSLSWNTVESFWFLPSARFDFVRRRKWERLRDQSCHVHLTERYHRPFFSWSVFRVDRRREKETDTSLPPCISTICLVLLPWKGAADTKSFKLVGAFFSFRWKALERSVETSTRIVRKHWGTLLR